MHKNAKDLTGQQSGRLTAICPTTKRWRGNIVWLCRCVCGNLTEASTVEFLRKNKKSCGCLKEHQLDRAHQKNLKHGNTRGVRPTRLYMTWRNMRNRCRNPKAKDYKHYGKKGIMVCSRWQHSFSLFQEWALNNGYQKYLTIDRINHHGNYEPDNCQWITMSENVKKAHKSKRKKI